MDLSSTIRKTLTRKRHLGRRAPQIKDTDHIWVEIFIGLKTCSTFLGGMPVFELFQENVRRDPSIDRLFHAGQYSHLNR